MMTFCHLFGGVVVFVVTDEGVTVLARRQQGVPWVGAFGVNSIPTDIMLAKVLLASFRRRPASVPVRSGQVKEQEFDHYYCSISQR